MQEPQPKRSAPAKRKRVRRKVTRRRQSVEPVVIEVAPDVDVEEPLIEKIRREVMRGGPGALVSFCVHVVILLVLGLIAAGVQNTNPDFTIEMGWLAPDALKGEDTGARPVRIAPISLDSPNKPKPIPKPITEEPGGQEKPEEGIVPAPPVKPVEVKKSLDTRSERMRIGLLNEVASDNKVEKAISSGLLWLARQQQSSGNWKIHEGYPDAGYRTARTDSGATALALLALLGNGNTHQSGTHRDVVRQGLKWLRNTQQGDGNLYDRNELGKRETYYTHCMGAIALCEAYAMTGDQDLLESAELAIQFILESQHPSKGGWKYRKQTEKTNGDLSVTGWALMALHSARMANISVPDESFDRASIFLDSVSVLNGSRYKYAPEDPRELITEAMTAEGLLCRQWLGWPRKNPFMHSGVNYITKEEFAPEWSSGRRNVYFWYYATQTLHNIGGDKWQSWYKKVAKEIVANQTRLGSSAKGKDVRGSWHPTKPLGSNHEYANQMGRLYITAMCVLILETPYRHAPVYPPPE
ncbi:MAG: hypothetical protein CMJ78_19215 [Planctomycetaceae bacterium]|nr:hypothetical protein [Planctomycetaceae bacterium]